MVLRKWQMAGVIAVSLALASEALARRECELGGKSINPDNGASFEGKTGIMKCTDNGKVVLEEEYRAGKPVGHRMTVDFQRRKVEGNYNEKGRRDGLFKIYDKDGALVAEETYKDDQQVGVARHYYPAKKPKEVSWYENGRVVFSAEYLENGQLSHLQCSDKSYFDEEAKLCGFKGGPSKVTLYESPGEVAQTLVLKNGKRVETQDFDTQGKVMQKKTVKDGVERVTEVFADGKIKSEAQRRDGVLDGPEKEYHESGKLIRTTQWNKGQLESEDLVYLNGNPRSKSLRRKHGTGWEVDRKEFWDNGKPKSEGLFREKTEKETWYGMSLGRWTYELPTGEQKTYFESGKPESDAHFNDDGDEEGREQVFFENGKPRWDRQYEKGVLKQEKEWDKDGKLVKNDTVFEDGSRQHNAK